ncbi:acetylcholine receptor subunit beta-type unc-29-like [Pecten maximus]|uniref:acetylcholine receptor subunit beta-type unc-29-like n=1 Tax=Pecten maximus TaxID=6579 RepID=UPI001457EE78|nr:acetylcholine receptor subunit beta-type unc-29-like [Pecten maximus]
MATIRVFLLLALWSSCGQLVLGRSGTMDDWIRLNNTLFSNYSKEIYPVYDFNDTLVINTAMFLLSILDFDEIAGVITLNGGVGFSWTDFRLTWDPSNFGGIEDILINSTLAWTPKAYLLNTAEDMEPFNLKDFGIRLMYNGNCFIAPGKIMKATCSVDMSDFPLDSHLCSILITLWGVHIDETRLGYNSTEFIMQYYTANGEWDIVDTSVAYSTATVYGVFFNINIKRRPIFFALSLIIPILLLCFLNPFVFLIPASSGERISYTITMFLALAVYMSIIGDSLPSISENMAGMSFFLLITLICSSSLIILTIFTLRYEALSDVSDFPRIIRRLTICFMKKGKNKVNARIHCVDEKEEQRETDEIDCDIKKDDVIRWVNLSLFVTSQIVTMIVIIWFFCHLFT